MQEKKSIGTPNVLQIPLPTGLMCDEIFLMEPSGLGELIREWRRPRRMSQAKLAVLVKCDSQTISNIETGKTRTLSGDHFRNLAAVFGQEPEVLFAKAEEIEAKRPRATGQIATAVAVLPSVHHQRKARGRSKRHA